MAKINKNGIISGTVNGMVFYEKDGKQFVRSAAKTHTDPKTTAQITHRTRHKLATALLSNIKYLIKIGYQKSEKATPSHEFISHVILDAVKGILPNQYIDYSLLRISRGKIPPPFKIKLENQVRGLFISWEADLRHAESLKNDHLVILLMNPNGESLIHYKLATRQDESATLQLPNGFTDTVHAWVFYHNPDKFPYESREKVSDSVYLGYY